MIDVQTQGGFANRADVQTQWMCDEYMYKHKIDVTT